jgi:uncharacterized damage-inducible protein DinB
MNPDQLAQHLRFSAWASARLLDAAAAVPAADARRDQGASFGSLEATLAHIFGADRIWLERITMPQPRLTLRDADEDQSIRALQLAWPAVHQGWIDWASSAGDQQACRVVRYQNLEGAWFATAAWQIVLHVVNHASYHRGQVVTLLRQLGYAPPRTDLIAFYRETGAAPRA